MVTVVIYIQIHIQYLKHQQIKRLFQEHKLFFMELATRQ